MDADNQQKLAKQSIAEARKKYRRAIYLVLLVIIAISIAAYFAGIVFFAPATGPFSKLLGSIFAFLVFVLVFAAYAAIYLPAERKLKNTKTKFSYILRNKKKTGTN